MHFFILLCLTFVDAQVTAYTNWTEFVLVENRDFSSPVEELEKYIFHN